MNKHSLLAAFSIMLAVVVPAIIGTKADVHAQQTSAFVLSVDWSPDGTQIATGDSQGAVRILDPNTFAVQKTIQALEREWLPNVDAIRWSPNGAYLAAGVSTANSFVGFIQIVNVASGQIVTSIRSGSSVTGVAWSPNGSLLAAGGNDRFTLLGWLKVWDTTDYQLIADLKHGRSADAVTSVSWSPDGTSLASAAFDEAGHDNSVIVWDTTTWELRLTLEHSDWLWTVAWSPDGSKIITAGRQLACRVWDAQTGEPLTELLLETSGMLVSARFIAWRPQSTQVMGMGSDSFFLWDTATGQILKRWNVDLSSNDFAWCPDNTCLVYGVSEGDSAPEQVRILSSFPPVAQ